VLTGDATQIDNPYLDSSSNGLSLPRRAAEGQGDRRPRDAGQERTLELASLVTAEL
jgi:hypothetical protein